MNKAKIKLKKNEKSLFHVNKECTKKYIFNLVSDKLTHNKKLTVKVFSF